MHIFLLPGWLEKMPEGRAKDIAIKRFYFRIAATYATPDGRFVDLAAVLGVHRKTLISQMSSKVRISDDTIDGIVEILHPIEIPDLLRIYKQSH